MVKISSASSSSNTAPGTHIKTEPCPSEEPLNDEEPDKHLLHSRDGAEVPDHISSEPQQIKQEHFETDFIRTRSRNVQPQAVDSRVSTKTEPECVSVNLSIGLKTESEIHDVGSGEAHFPLKEEEEEEDVTKIKLEAAEEESDPRQHEEAGRESFFSCPYCAVSFTDSSYLEKHLKWTHRSNYLVWLKTQKAPQCIKISSQMLSCTSCNLHFFTQEQLKVHMRRTHLPTPAPTRKRYTCPQCDRSFDYIGNLQNHCRRCHNLSTVCTDGELSCASCGENFAVPPIK
ncbi:hypothetical protein AMELA_G00224680 [Ameiurus melas]|uniref:C2H2-type domain-containing protein n=1 Tax=Ameiurus melas TaxID=219545 RepID=A0A7J6A388_AMEME|nr:hypothetical protein AMELA_G00224680 [Ameiurus melas]